MCEIGCFFAVSAISVFVFAIFNEPNNKRCPTEAGRSVGFGEVDRITLAGSGIKPLNGFQSKRSFRNEGGSTPSSSDDHRNHHCSSAKEKVRS
uniref:Transmembrane protein n=1 Tax=Steinernema glaseri TaxID=37863 RepID=A0A1I7YUZ2_9BILA